MEPTEDTTAAETAHGRTLSSLGYCEGTTSTMCWLPPVWRITDAEGHQKLACGRHLSHAMPENGALVLPIR